MNDNRYPDIYIPPYDDYIKPGEPVDDYGYPIKDRD